MGPPSRALAGSSSCVPPFDQVNRIDESQGRGLKVTKISRGWTDWFLRAARREKEPRPPTRETNRGPGQCRSQILPHCPGPDARAIGYCEV